MTSGAVAVLWDSCVMGIRSVVCYWERGLVGEDAMISISMISIIDGSVVGLVKSWWDVTHKGDS